MTVLRKKAVLVTHPNPPPLLNHQLLADYGASSVRARFMKSGPKEKVQWDVKCKVSKAFCHDLSQNTKRKIPFAQRHSVNIRHDSTDVPVTTNR